MKKRILVVGLFVVLFLLSVLIMFVMQKNAQVKSESPVVILENKTVSRADELKVYKVEDLSEECQSDDKIFCAIERVVKCTMKPDMAGCNKDVVPSFVLGDTGETERPKKMSFKIIKMKPISGTSNLSVYTESDCDAQWFGLCKGTVIYSLEPTEAGAWVVHNIYALE